MLVDREYILQNLRALQTANFREAEENLHEKLKTMPGAVDHLVAIMSSDEQDFMKLSASTFLNTAIISEVEGTQDTTHMCKLISSIISNPKIGGRCKSSLQRAITLLIEETSSSGDTDYWINLTLELMRGGMGNPSANLIMEGYSLAEMEESSFLLYANSVLVASVKDIAQPGRTIDDIKEWAVVFGEIFQRLSELCEKEVNSVSAYLIEELCQFEPLAVVIEKVYLEGAQNSILLTNNYQLNSLKYEICSIHQKLVNFMFFQKKPLCQLQSILLARMLPYFTSTLLAISENCQQQLDKDSHAREFVVEIMRIYKRCIKIIDFAPLFQSEAKRIILTILLPMMSMGTKQKELFNTDPQEWCNLADDIVDRQTSITLKTEVTSILQSLIDSIDGCATWIFDLAIDSMLCNLGELSKEGLPIVLDYCRSFIILTSMSFIYTNHRRDLLYKLRKFWTQHFQILSKLNSMQLAWCYIFLSFNYTDLFPCASEGQQYILHASQYSGHQTTMHSAIDFISNITQQYYTDELFKSMDDRAATCESLVLWDIYIMYSTSVTQKISEQGMMYLVACLYNRMASDLVKLAKSKHGEGLIYIIKSLAVITGICKNAAYMKDKPVLEAKIWEIFNILKHTKRIEFEHDTLTILVLLLSRSSLTILGDRQFQLLPLLEEIMSGQISDNLFLTMFSVLNFYILKTPPLQHPSTRKLLDLLLLGLSSDERKEVRNSAVLILLQIFVKRFEPVLCKVEVKKIDEALEELDLQSAKAYSRLMNLKVLMYPLQQRVGLVSKNPFIDELLAEEELYQSQYERKVLVMGLCWALFQQKDFLSIGEMLNIMTRQLVHYQENSSIEKRKTKQKITLENSIERLRTDWKRVDIFVHFRQQLNRMQATNPVVYHQLITSLTRDVQSKMESIANVFTIHSTPRKIFKVGEIVARSQPNLDCEFQHPKHERQKIEDEDLVDDNDIETQPVEKEVPKSQRKKVKK